MAKKLVNPQRLYDGTPFGLSQAVVDCGSGGGRQNCYHVLMVGT
jgi:hypothetical protein